MTERQLHGGEACAPRAPRAVVIAGGVRHRSIQTPSRPCFSVRHRARYDPGWIDHPDCQDIPGRHPEECADAPAGRRGRWRALSEREDQQVGASPGAERPRPKPQVCAPCPPTRHTLQTAFTSLNLPVYTGDGVFLHQLCRNNCVFFFFTSFVRWNYIEGSKLFAAFFLEMAKLHE